jgi:signal transduction histidine kinase
MLDRLGMLCAGLGAVIDTVVLLAILEPRNLRRVMAPVAPMVLGAWLLHAGGFIHGLVGPMHPDLARPSHHVSMTAMALGLLLMPCAMTHVILRILRTGLVPRPRVDFRYALLYAPVLLVFWAERRIAVDPLEWFLKLMEPLVVPYVVWTSGVCMLAAAGFVAVRHRSKVPLDRRLFGGLALALLAMAGVLVGSLLYGPTLWSKGLAYLQLVGLMAPLIPTVLFGYFVIRFHFLRLMMGRTVLYGGIVVGVLLFHWLTVRSVGRQIEAEYRIDFGVVESIVVILLVLAIQPWRERTLEALRYLIGGQSASLLRDRLRTLSLSVVRQGHLEPATLLDWFVKELRLVLSVDWVAGWLFDDSMTVLSRSTSSATIDDGMVTALCGDLSEMPAGFVTLREMPTRRSMDLMYQARASGAVRFEVESIRGLILLGRRPRNADFGEEEANALSLVTELLAATMQNAVAQKGRREAEKRALQHEKLSTLGLLAGSIVHDIKNPLSSIQTIGTVMAEELGPDHRHRDDLLMILSEVRRLTESTGEILDFARPKSAGRNGSLAKVLRGVVRVLEHSARQRRVRLEVAETGGLSQVGMGEDGLQEVFFNLVSNAIQAAGENGKVEVVFDEREGRIVSDVFDSGPGIADAVADRLFEPFATAKEDGTGLGLFAVRRRLDEVGGRVSYERTPTGRTRFRVELPTSDA